jgi:hypothetical protein
MKGWYTTLNNRMRYEGLHSAASAFLVETLVPQQRGPARHREGFPLSISIPPDLKIHPDNIPTNAEFDVFFVIAGQDGRTRKSAGHRPESGVLEFIQIYASDGRNSAHNPKVGGSNQASNYVNWRPLASTRRQAKVGPPVLSRIIGPSERPINPGIPIPED